MTIKPLRYLLLACFALGCASLAQADIIVTPTFDASNQAAPPDTTNFEGNFFDFSSTFPPDPITIGTFDFTIPTNYVITGATISGTFDDVNVPATALVALYLGGLNINVGCDDSNAPCATNQYPPLATWSQTLTATELNELASDFAGGSLDFTAVQSSFEQVVIGAPTLDIQVAQTPEPSSIFTLAGGCGIRSLAPPQVTLH